MQENQRSAPNTLLNPVQGENFEDHQISSDDAEELEYQRSAPHPLLEYHVLDETLKTSATSPLNPRNWNVNGLHDSPLQRRVRDDRRHMHQLFRRLRWVSKVHHTMTRNLIQRDLRHFDNRLGNHRRVELPHEFDHLHLPHLRHRSIEDLNRHKGLDNLLRRVPLDPQL